jgi:hypothetical protein
MSGLATWLLVGLLVLGCGAAPPRRPDQARAPAPAASPTKAVNHSAKTAEANGPGKGLGPVARDGENAGEHEPPLPDWPCLTVGRYLKAALKEAGRCSGNDECTRTSEGWVVNRGAELEVLRKWDKDVDRMCLASGTGLVSICAPGKTGEVKCISGYCVVSEAPHR